jgi:SulP family sulfate permease
MRSFFNLFDLKLKVNYKNEILSGLTVALALVPEAIAFALLAGLSPLTGLYAAFSIGLITSIFGGRPGMISGATGAIAVVYLGLISVLKAVQPDISVEEITENIFAVVIMAGLIQIFAGILKLGKFIRLVPHPVMFGFVNGLAIVIFMSQSESFKIKGEWISGSTLYLMIALVLLTMLIIWGLPKITKAIPSGLVAIIIVSAISIGLGLDTKTVGDIASIQGGFPPFHVPMVDFTWSKFIVLFPYALIVAGVGLIESLLTLNLIDEITQTRGKGNKECVAQGAANIATGLFSGMGGCAMIGQSLINISSGARARLSGIVASVGLLCFILFGAPVIEQLPMAALTGVMVMVSIGTFEWASLKVFGRMPKSDVFVMIIVTLVTIFLHNLALAVLIGVVISALVFAWENATRIRARKFIDENGAKHYEIFGPLFFGSISAFNEKFDIKQDPNEVIINFAESRITDMSAIEVLNSLTERYARAGKKVHLKHLSPDCLILINNADKVIDVNVLEDPTYKVVVEGI